ncbi:GDP-mannose 6-dehydrogenase [Candidatus Defluviicoccus seviourii]|uniref:UDP-glucose 6-dehydrogenase n=1 Tax=Candidatus Defluviicoccus seviourii TaxID=2565273 RepID=A0A564WD52_9PROT|nr:GDP-mannose 6-dehydrogenase [Candidatus Defluviicoccus seviourii]
MRISVFGLGYVGCVSAACLAHGGHRVIGVDVNPTKVDLINRGALPVVEPGLDTMIAEALKSGTLSATTDAAKAVNETDLSLVCVGTPSQPSGSLDLTYVARVCEQIGAALATKAERHVVVIRSTILPGTSKNLITPALEKASGKRVGEGFGLCHNPEFLREGTAVRDYYEPPKIVIGGSDKKACAAVEVIYQDIKAPLIVTDIEVAELVKYADNCWHAVKVSFANEIGNIAKAVGVDSHRVMEIFCRDDKLNLSPYYLKPGFAFGGSCLPKDLRALAYAARQVDVPVPLLTATLESNRLQIKRGLELVMAAGGRKVGVLGFSFKAGTDDVRESPIIEVIEGLIGKGYDLKLYDRNVRLASLIGANREFLETRIPHIARLMVDRIDDVLAHGDVIVVGNKAQEFQDVLGRLRNGQKVIDLVRIAEARCSDDHYQGICW